VSYKYPIIQLLLKAFKKFIRMILVTGATGFLGSELIKQLIAKGKSVRAIKRQDSVIPELVRQERNIDWQTADILDYFALKEAFRDISEVYHCAAFISFNPTDKKKMLKVNAGGTANVVNLCLENSIKKLVHVSSVAAVGKGKAGELITEKDHWEFNAGQSGYSISKYESEMEVFRAVAEGLDAVIVNPSIIIGKNAGKEGSGQLFETVRKGLKYYPGGSCGLVDVEDVAKTMITLMESTITAERFLVNAENRSYHELFTEIAEQFKIKPPAIALNPWMLKLACFASGLTQFITGKNYRLTKDAIRFAFKKQSYSNDKIKKAIDIQFKPIKRTIAEVCAELN
jgi:dihydroflavonol-4-reductase